MHFAMAPLYLSPSGSNDQHAVVWHRCMAEDNSYTCDAVKAVSTLQLNAYEVVPRLPTLTLLCASALLLLFLQHCVVAEMLRKPC